MDDQDRPPGTTLSEKTYGSRWMGAGRDEAIVKQSKVISSGARSRARKASKKAQAMNTQIQDRLTVMIDGLHPLLRTEEGLRACLDKIIPGQVFSVSVVVRGSLCPAAESLNKLHRRRMKTVQALEKSLVTGDSPTVMVTPDGTVWS